MNKACLFTSLHPLSDFYLCFWWNLYRWRKANCFIILNGTPGCMALWSGNQGYKKTIDCHIAKLRRIIRLFWSLSYYKQMKATTLFWMFFPEDCHAAQKVDIVLIQRRFFEVNLQVARGFLQEQTVSDLFVKTALYQHRRECFYLSFLSKNITLLPYDFFLMFSCKCSHSLQIQLSWRSAVAEFWYIC